MRKKDQQKWLALVVLIALAALVANRYMSFMQYLALYNLAYFDNNYVVHNDSTITGFFAEYRPSWDGQRIVLAVGRGGLGGTPSEGIKDILLPLRYKFRSDMADNGIIPGKSKCELKLTILACDEQGSCSGIPTTNYPIDPAVPIYATLEQTSNIDSDEFFMSSTSGGQPYYYYHDYDCVLDTPYPIEGVINATQDMMYSFEVALLPAPSTDDESGDDDELAPPEEPIDEGQDGTTGSEPEPIPSRFDLFVSAYKLPLFLLFVIAILIITYLMRGG